MTKEKLAELLNGREYGDEITEEDEQMAKESGLLVIFGYSDDNAELRGIIDDEVSCYDGGEFFIHPTEGLLEDHNECECKHCGFERLMMESKKVEAVWNKYGYSWTYKTDVPHARFDIKEDGENYCRGIVISQGDLLK